MSLYQHAATLYNRLPEDWRSACILGGGCLRAYYDGTKIKDIDIFFRCQEDYDGIKQAMDADALFVLRKDSERYCEFTYLPDGSVFNLVGFAFGSPREHLDRFDFRCCQFVAWWEGEDALQIDAAEHAQEDAHGNLLYIENNNGTERTLRRIKHYVADYGYSLHPEQGIEQEDAFEGTFSEFEGSDATPEWMKQARRRVSALAVQQYPYKED